MNFDLPWWAIVYLVFAAFLSFSSAIDDLRDKRLIMAFASVVSFLCVFLLVCTFYNIPFRSTLNWLVFPMTLLGLGWECYSTSTDLMRAEKEILEQEHDLSDTQKQAILNIAMIAN